MPTIRFVDIAGAFLFGVVGLLVGSFLNVCIDRLPRDRSVVRPPSHCEACGHRLGLLDLIPIVSYIVLRGRCRYCQAGISGKMIWVELATGLIFALLYWHYGLTARFGIVAYYAALFIVVFVIDIEHELILNKVVYPALIVALLFSLVPQPWLPRWVVSTGIANAAMAGAIGFAIFFLIAVVSRGGMGWGDVKLVALIGLATGFPLVLFTIVLAAIIGTIVAVALMIARRRRFREALPFGPFLAVATMIALVWGSDVLAWYMGLMVIP
jgi:leader peptidase (prepilin peptidase) / N-methyltransferase